MNKPQQQPRPDGATLRRAMRHWDVWHWGSGCGPLASFVREIEDADALWRALATKGRLDSLAVVRRPDANETSVEFVTIANGDGSGRNVTVLLEVADLPAPVAARGDTTDAGG